MNSPREILATATSVLLVGGVAAFALAFDTTSLPVAEAVMPDVATSSVLHPLLEPPAGAREISVGREIVTNGQRMNLNITFVDQDAHTVAHFYADRLLEREIPFRLEHGDAFYHIMATTKDGGQLAIAVHEQEEGALVVPVLSSGFLTPGKERDQVPLPIPEDHMALLTSVADDAGKKSSSAQFLSKMTVEALEQWYVEKLAPIGYRRLPGTPGRPGPEGLALIRFEASTSLATVSLRGLGHRGGTAVSLLYETNVNRNAP